MFLSLHSTPRDKIRRGRGRSHFCEKLAGEKGKRMSKELLSNQPANISPRLLLVLYLFALIARLVWLGVFSGAGLALDDMYQYDMLGRSLAEGNGFRWYKPADVYPIASLAGIDLATVNIPPEGLETTFRAPLYPAFLALIYYFSGLNSRLFVARLAQVMLGATLAPLTALLAQRLGVHPRGAVIGGAILALYPILTFYPLALVNENLFFPLTLVGMLLILRASEGRRWQDYLWTGLAFGLAALTRSIITAFLPVAALTLRRRGVNGNHGILIMLAVFVAVTAPWAIRNTLLSGRPTFIETSLGYNLFIGYYPDNDGSFSTKAAIIPLHIIDDAARDKWTTEKALEFIQADPRRVPGLIVSKWRYFWGLEKRALMYFYSNGFFGDLPPAILVPAFLLFTLPLVLVITLAIPGLVFAPAADKRWFVLLFAGSYILPHLLIMAEDRFHLALMPYLAAYAGHALSTRKDIFARLKGERGLLLLTLAALAVFFLGWSVELASDWPKLLTLLGPGGWRVGLSY